MVTLSASHCGESGPNQARTAESGNITSGAIPGGSIEGGILQGVVIHGRFLENGKIKAVTIQDGIIHSGTIQVAPIQSGTTECVMFKDGNIQSENIQTEIFLGPNYVNETGEETTRLRKDATPVKLDVSEVRKGPNEVRKGPAEVRKGPTEVRKGPSEVRKGHTELRESPSEVRKGPNEEAKCPTDVRKGPTEIRKGPIEVRKSPTEVRKSPTEVRKSPTEVRKGSSQVRKGSIQEGNGATQVGRNPSKQTIRATKETENTIKINNGASGITTCVEELRKDVTDQRERTNVDSKKANKFGEEMNQTTIMNDVKQPREPMVRERTEEAKKTERLQRLNDSSPYEEDVVYGPEANLQEHYDDCRKNPKHEQFFPFTSFGPQHLPARYHKKSVFELVKTLGALTVKLSVTYVSQNRPETFNGIPYPRYLYRGQKRFAFGSGRVVQVKKFTITDGQTCPCSDCKKTSGVQEWAQIRVATATHVVFDDEEAEHTTVSFNCDSDTSQVTSITGMSAKADVEGDVSNLFCATHDLDFAASLAGTVERYKRLSQKVFEKYEGNKEEEHLVIIVSHPHGCPKQVSVGQWTDKTDIVKQEFTTVYVNAEQDEYQDEDYNDPYENFGVDDDLYYDDDRNYDDFYDQYYEEDERNNDDYYEQYYEEDERNNDDYYEQYYGEDERNNDDYYDQYNEENDRNNDDYYDQYNEEDDRNNDVYDEQDYEEDDRNNYDYDEQYYEEDDRNNDDYDEQYYEEDVRNNDDYDDQYNDDDEWNYDENDERYNDDNDFADYYDELCDDDYDDSHCYHSTQKLVNSYTCSKYLYTACTCPGSSGATVFLFGRDDWTTDHLHSTGTAAGNLSGYAFKQDL